MLERGARKLAQAGMASRAFLAAGDAERIPLASDRFDGVLIAFGIRNVGDPLAALGEIRRCCGPAGGWWCWSSPFRRCSAHSTGSTSSACFQDRRHHQRRRVRLFLPAGLRRPVSGASDFGALMERAGFDA